MSFEPHKTNPAYHDMVAALNAAGKGRRVPVPTGGGSLAPLGVRR